MLKVVRVHVLAEDHLGSRVAVYCLRDSGEVNSGKIVEILDSIESYFFGDCTLAVAIPYHLMHLTAIISRLACRIYVIDAEGKVWIHT
ncbi:hypothetical protein H5T51_06860 [Candidatus Bathyarchaeota archaeon]|nr:hypothetical protein [Candidatus Bathyarchaeota archaeon]